MYNLTYNLVPSKDASYGVDVGNGSFTGVVGMVQVEIIYSFCGGNKNPHENIKDPRNKVAEWTDREQNFKHSENMIMTDILV